MRTNKNCPKYGDDSETRVENTDLDKLSSARSSFVDQAELSQQKPLIKKLIPKTGTKIGASEAPEDDNKPTSKAKILKVKCGATDKLPDRNTPPNSQSSDRPIISDAETGSKSVKVSKITFSNKMKPDDVLVEPAKPSIVIKPPVDGDRDQPRKKIIIRQQPKEIISLDDNSQDGSFGHDHRKTKKIIELSSLDRHMERDSSRHLFEESSRMRDPDGNQLWVEQRRRIGERQQEERYRRVDKLKMIEDQSNELLRYEESIRREREEEEHQRAKAKKKKKRKHEIKDDYLDDFPPRRNDRRIPDRDRIVRRRVVEPDYGKHAPDFAPSTKRRRGGEVSSDLILMPLVKLQLVELGPAHFISTHYVQK